MQSEPLITHPPRAPGAGEVHLWQVVLDGPASLRAGLARHLSPEERTRSARFRYSRDRDRYIVRRGSLRRIVGSYLLTEPAAVRFRLGPAGKPAIAGSSAASALRFSVTHSDGLALIAVTTDLEVGVDLERALWTPDLPEVAAHTFSRAENAALRRLPADLWTSGFYRCWTTKEAVIKCTGEGLNRPLDSFDVEVDPRRPAALLRFEDDADRGHAWGIHCLDSAPGFVAVVAAWGRLGPIRRFQLPAVRM